MRFYWDYAWLGGNEYYKVFCIEYRKSNYELFKIKITSDEYMLRKEFN